MTNRELFFAISDVVKHEVQSAKTELRSELDQKIQEVKSELDQKIQEVKSELGGEIDSLKTEVAGVKAEVAGMKEDIAGVKAEVADLKTDVRTVNLKLENEVNFKLRLLLENYMPAAKKYEMESEHVEILQSDMGTVKKAVEAHSGIINKHSEIIKEHGEQLAQLVKLA